MTYRSRWCAPTRFAALAGLLVCLASCSKHEKLPDPQPAAQSVPDQRELNQRIDQVLEFTRQERVLTIETNAAWQILHLVLAFGRDARVDQDGQSIAVVDYLLQGGQLNGWDWELVSAGTPPQPSVRLLTSPGSKTGQGHADQWLAVLAQCHVQPDEIIQFGNQAVPFQAVIDQMLRDVNRNVDQEFSWTLIAALEYYPTTHTWVAGDGTQWSIEKLVRIELDQELAQSACGGTHRLIGLATAVNHRRKEQASIDGVWQSAADRIQFAARRARELQNPDGSLSTNYFERPGFHSDLKEHLGATGHMLEFLALSQPADVLTQPWVRRAAERLCRLFELTRNIPLECGALYHAAHGLKEYRAATGGSDHS